MRPAENALQNLQQLLSVLIKELAEADTAISPVRPL